MVAVVMAMTVLMTMTALMTMTVFVTLTVFMTVVAAAEQEDARHIDDQAQHRNRNGFVEIDRNRPDQALRRLIGDQDRDHGEDDGAGKSGEIAELAGAEREARVVAMAAGIAVGQSREQERARMRRHMQPVGDQRDRAEQQSADDLDDHHETAQRDHHPGAALVALMACAEKDVIVAARGVGHDCVACYFR